MAFPGEGPSASPSTSPEQIRMSGKMVVISRAVWRLGLPSCLASEPRSAPSAHSHGCHRWVGSSLPTSQIPHQKLPSLLLSSLFSLLLKSEAT